MNGSILTLNAGSSSLKFALFEANGEAPLEQARGQVEGLDTKPRMAIKDPHGGMLEEQQWSSGEGPDSAQAALRHTLAWLEATYPRLRVVAVGHRVAHGGPEYSAPVVLDQGVITTLRQFNPLAPLHQPHNLTGVEAARAAFPQALQVACFDSAFHRAHPWVNDVFAIPKHFYDEGVRRYGFHGLSYDMSRGSLPASHPSMPQVAWRWPIWATAPACARSATVTASAQPWVSRRWMACPWARARDRSIRGYCCT